MSAGNYLHCVSCSKNLPLFQLVEGRVLMLNDADVVEERTFENNNNITDESPKDDDNQIGAITAGATITAESTMQVRDSEVCFQIVLICCCSAYLISKLL